MAGADAYWLSRLMRDRKLAERAAEEVDKEVWHAYRAQYLEVSKKLEQLYAEVQSRGTFSRTKAWNYVRYRELEQQLVEYCEAGRVIQVDAITKACDRVFNEVIGADVTRFKRGEIILPHNPRAVIDTAWSGENYSSRIWRNQQELAIRLRSDVQRIMMGDVNPVEVKRSLMRDYDVAMQDVKRLVDTELAYVQNRAAMENYRRRGYQKLMVLCLEVNSCDRCLALDGEVFRTEDAPVLPIHPNCHCAYCVPKDGDEAQVTASGANLAEVYERKGAGTKQYTPKQRRAAEAAKENGLIPASELQAKVEKAVTEAAPGLAGNAPAGLPTKSGDMGAPVLTAGAEGGIMEPREIRRQLSNEKAIPGAAEAVIARDKLAGYLLDLSHKDGGPKAKLIKDVSGYTETEWQQLGEEIQNGLQTADRINTTDTEYGKRYEVPIRVRGKKNKSMVYFTIWQVDKGTQTARFITSKFDVRTIREERK